ncbi:cysteine proteinase [Daldinia caldariorum]|uniref:cysteine proteinase n=1 Tax=Daldinia caldariorum TaxID=326644 RepID=UPI0020084650|nr:cysteine proteinase [Daldinia caldariorum]KAI1473239.1 cysteine proteinase [Daldinia caldariorum]
MSSITFARASIAPMVGGHDTMSSGTSNDRGTAASRIDVHSPGAGSGTGRPPYRHIDDLVSVSVDLDPHTPLRKVLELGDGHMRQAITYSDFHRPDLALQEYIKAFTIAVDKVPKHKEYPSMSSDRGDLNRLYKALKMKITTNGATFDKIKEDIKENNRRSGVQPTRSPQRPADALNRANNAHDVKDSIVGERRPKPTVQPKPEALHGKAIKQTPTTHSEDLTNRFARLRDPQKSRKVAEVVSQPSAGGGQSTPSQALYSVDTAMPVMPKLPEAIYSPARGTVTSELANLPSSTPRGMFSRTNSTASSPSVSARISTENAIRLFGREQFAAAHSYRAAQSSATPTKVPIPNGDDITAAALAELISKYPQVDVLVIDIRDRESFDEGHIKSAKTVCIEPEILMRENVSADEIADSMVLAPSNERLAVEQRDRVDLVVIYDQDSTSIPSRITGNSLEMVLYNIRQALSYYSYSRPLKNVPKLLSGGLNSWVLEFGEASLETSGTISNSMSPSSALRRKYGDRRRSRTKTLSQNEISQFEEMIKNDRVRLDNFDYVKTREDFIRRYPSIRGDPESMTSVKEDLDSQEDFLASIAPAPPRLPAPALPRTRYSGLESRDVDSGVGGIAMAADPASAISARPVTGLHNPGNWCYCNSALQALVVSPGFIIELFQPEWPQNWRWPTNREPAQAQLLCRLLKPLLMWLAKRVVKSISATTVMRYLESIHEGYKDVSGKIIRLGDNSQHDADEFLSFVSEQMAAETNMSLRYNQTAENVMLPRGENRAVKSLVSLFLQQWTGTKAYNFIDRHFASLVFYTTSCTSCYKISHSAQPERGFTVSPPESGRVTLTKLLDEWFEPGGILCSRCQKPEDGTQTDKPPPPPLVVRRPRLAKLPRLLRIYIRRQIDRNDIEKNKTGVTFPLELDMAPYTEDAHIREGAAKLLGDELSDGMLAPTSYELYAVQVHNGPIVSSGHYWTWVKHQQPDTWTRCEDTFIKQFSGVDWQKSLDDLHKCPGNATPVGLFYKRKDIPWAWESNLDDLLKP